MIGEDYGPALGNLWILCCPGLWDVLSLIIIVIIFVFISCPYCQCHHCGQLVRRKVDICHFYNSKSSSSSHKIPKDDQYSNNLQQTDFKGCRDFF